MEFQPNLRPERCKYNFLFFFYVRVIYEGTLIFNELYSYILKCHKGY